jgi:hypothetical protein
MVSSQTTSNGDQDAHAVTQGHSTRRHHSDSLNVIALHDSQWIVCLAVLPLLIFAAVVNVRRILRAVS